MSSPAHNPSIRLNKYLSDAGVCSRRKADELIAAGRVAVNGKPVTALGAKVDPGRDKIFVDGRQAVILDEPVYILLNKPHDCITTSRDERGRRTVMHYVRVRERVFPVGRLDRQTTGVLLLTNDGELAHALMHPRHEVEKGYEAALDRPLLPQHAASLAAGVRLADGMTRPADVVILKGGKEHRVGIVIREGRNRQVHRMFGELGYEVAKLDRVSYAGVTCRGLKRGEWRHLTAGEVARLRKAAGIL